MRFKTTNKKEILIDEKLFSEEAFLSVNNIQKIAIALALGSNETVSSEQIRHFVIWVTTPITEVKKACLQLVLSNRVSITYGEDGDYHFNLLPAIIIPGVTNEQ